MSKPIWTQNVTHALNVLCFSLVQLADVIGLPREDIKEYFLDKQVATINRYQSYDEAEVPYHEIQSVDDQNSFLMDFLIKCAKYHQNQHPSKVRFKNYYLCYLNNTIIVFSQHLT